MHPFYDITKRGEMSLGALNNIIKQKMRVNGRIRKWKKIKRKTSIGNETFSVKLYVSQGSVENSWNLEDMQFDHRKAILQ